MKIYDDKFSLEELEAALKKHGSHEAAAKALGLKRTTFRDMYYRLKDRREHKVAKPVSIKKPRRGIVKRFILGGAQGNAEPHLPFLKNLEVYAEHVGAKILLAPIQYNPWGSRKETFFHEAVEPYITQAQHNIADKLLFCAELRIQATATTPLSGLETYTREMWGVFPHGRVALKSVATMFHDPCKMIMTTGAVTRPKYLPHKAGIKAEFHHVIAALIVEVDGEGDVFVRQLIADADGNFQDLETCVLNGSICERRVAAITWGDIHTEQLDPTVLKTCWGEGGILDTLAPQHQFFHDVLDFQARNHHNINDPHFRYKMYASRTEDVLEAIRKVAHFLQLSRRDWSVSHIVESNHDLMFLRWLKESSYKNDPVNARFFIEAQRAVYEAIAAHDDGFSVFEWAVKRELPNPDAFDFLRETDSCVVARVEHGLHGHRGANGAKGSLSSFSKMGPRAFVGHYHSAAILEGVWQVGTSSKLDMGYNRGGLSSWNHTHGITYLSGKRALITMQGEKWRA